MTTPSAPAAPEQPADTDQALANLAIISGEYLAGIIADGMLDTVGQPGKLPTLLFPDIPEDHVWRVWSTALAVGYRASRLAGSPRFHRDTLARLQLALAEAGHAAMAGLAARTATVAATPDHHPADTEPDTARGEHW